MRTFIAGCAAVLLLLAPVAGAQPATGWMADEEIRRAFAGVTIAGIYVDGTTFIESYANSGSLAYSDPRKSLIGRWSVVNRSFCTLYDDSITGGCFKVSRHSANCYEFYFLAGSESGAAKDERAPTRWTARGWDQSRIATCDEKPAV